MIERLLRKIFNYRDIVIDNELYLTRFFLTPRTWHLKLFLHVIYKPDSDRSLHDHPWSFWNMILKGGYIEDEGNGKFTYRLPFSVKKKEYDKFHSVFFLFSKTWTLVLAGKAIQVWGFQTDKGKISWRDYLNKSEQYPEDVVK